MQSDMPLDYAVFQLSPRKSRCELFVSYDGNTEKLASGLVKPFVTHLKVAEEQVALPGKSIKLNVEGYKNAEIWFTKGTLERFVRFVSTPEVLEMVNTFDAEMSQLEAARKIYSQGSPGDNGGTTPTSDATKKELLRAIDVRLSAVKQDLISAYNRASTAGFNPQTVSELQLFADHFGAHRLSDACCKFITLTKQRSDLFNSNTMLTWNVSSDKVLRSSNESDMSIDDSFDDQSQPATCTTTKIPLPFSSRRFSREPSPNPCPVTEVNERENIRDFDKDKGLGSTTNDTSSTTESSIGKPQLTRRLSVQERISLFENKAQTSPSSSATTPTSSSTGLKPEFRRLSSDVNSSNTDKAVLRRWSGASDMSIDVNGDRKEPGTNSNTPTPSSALKSKHLNDSKLEEANTDSKQNSEVNESVLLESKSNIPSFAGRSTVNDQSRAGEFDSPVHCESEDLGSLVGKEPKNVSAKSLTKIENKLVVDKSVAKNDVLKDQPVHRSHFCGIHVQPAIQSIGVKVDPVLTKTVEKDSDSSHNQTEGYIKQMENQVTRGGAQRESGSGSSVPTDQVQRSRQAKGTQEANDDLKMKANELEKLFAEHKLRLPTDPSNSARRIIRPADVAKDFDEPDKDNNEMEIQVEKKLNLTPLLKTSDNHNNDVTPKQNVCSISSPDESKGKLYQKYMQKRNAKLKDDWSCNRPQKEAQMKAMHDSLEKSRAVMKVKLAGSTQKSNLANDTRRRDDKIRFFDVQSATKNDQPKDLFLSDEDEDQAKTIQNKRVQPNKNTSSSPSTRNSTGPITRSSGKASNSAAGRRRLPYDNPLTQSVPNFSDLKKENTRPSPGGSKPIRPQPRNHARKKSPSEEEKSRRFQSLRKNTANAIELNETLNSDEVVDKEEIVDMVKDEENANETIIPVDNCENERLSHESEKSGNALDFSSEIGRVSQESPGESPGYWNTTVQNPFTFPHEISDIDASDSPSGSPASWNFQTVSQSENEAARMRKQWGVSEKPVISIDPSRSPSRKDNVTKGLKRFLKFGRKNRASDNVADWISATTSEGDDSEDGRDVANRSSEDLRKSRMGFGQSHNSDEGFNGNELFNEQVQALRSSIPTPPSNFKLRDEHLSGSSLKAPKSFFSLSNFRSKNTDSKPR